MKKQVGKNTYFWFGIFAICFFSFQVISYNIRPNYKGDNELIMYFLGIAPNFFPAAGIPSLIFAILGLYKFDRQKFIHDNAFYLSFWIGVVGLIIWEFLQIFSKNLSFDWHDILWTIVGGLVFAFLGKITKQSKHRDNAGL